RAGGAGRRRRHHRGRAARARPGAARPRAGEGPHAPARGQEGDGRAPRRGERRAAARAGGTHRRAVPPQSRRPGDRAARVKAIDLRSDTVTQPTPAMREAMARAELGDDVYGEDPTVNALEAAAAARVGKEAALFVPSGTMANQIAIRLHTHHGEVVLASAGAHVLRYEGGAASALSGVQIATIGTGGLFTAADVRAAYVPPSNVHLAPTTLLAAENTHNAAGGRVFPVDQLHEAVRAAQDLGLRAHLDGARIFNAEVASGVPAARIAEPFDTVAFCFSKGLGAPVGSVLCGTREAIE